MIGTLKPKTEITVPKSIRRKAGIKTGDQFEFSVSGRVITIVPKVPSAADEYTPEQRRRIDAQLDEAEKGPFHGPFKTADAMIAHVKRELKKRATLKKAKRS
jgi:AbrB family looped-hinge helix DNA binding protein